MDSLYDTIGISTHHRYFRQELLARKSTLDRIEALDHFTSRERVLWEREICLANVPGALVYLYATTNHPVIPLL